VQDSSPPSVATANGAQIVQSAQPLPGLPEGAGNRRWVGDVGGESGSGRLRPDFALQDLLILLMANAGVIAATHATAPASWRRLVGYMLQAFAAPYPATLPPLPPDPGDLARSMLGLTARQASSGPGQRDQARLSLMTRLLTW
jgi:hypothetical protein